MNLNEDTEDTAFRLEMHRFVRNHLPAELRAKSLTLCKPSKDDLVGWHRINAVKSIDGRTQAETHVDDVFVPKTRFLEIMGAGLAPMRHAIHRSSAALLAEGIGAMERLLEMSVEHLKTLQQFGQPLSQSQALQHHIAGMATSVEQATPMSLMVATGSILEDEKQQSAYLSQPRPSCAGRRSMLQNLLPNAWRHGHAGGIRHSQRCFRRLLAVNASWGTGSNHTRC